MPRTCYITIEISYIIHVRRKEKMALVTVMVLSFMIKVIDCLSELSKLCK